MIKIKCSALLISICLPVLNYTYSESVINTSSSVAKENFLLEAKPKNKISDAPIISWDLVLRLSGHSKPLLNKPLKENVVDSKLIAECKKDAHKFICELLELDPNHYTYLKNNYYKEYETVLVYRLDKGDIDFYVCAIKPKQPDAPEMTVVYGYDWSLEKWFLRALTFQL